MVVNYQQNGHCIMLVDLNYVRVGRCQTDVDVEIEVLGELSFGSCEEASTVLEEYERLCLSIC